MQEKIENFLTKLEPGDRIAFITSGGSLIYCYPESSITINNHSEGKRSSKCAEEFLKLNYKVIFLHREESFTPFIHYLTVPEILKSIYVDKDQISIINPYKDTLIYYKKLLENHSQNLLIFSYTSVEEYIQKKK